MSDPTADDSPASNIRQEVCHLYAAEVAGTLIRIAHVCAAEKNYREATQRASRAVAIRQSALGREHPDTVETVRDYTHLARNKP